MKFQIPSMYLSTAEEKIGKLNRKADKLKIDRIVYTVDQTPITKKHSYVDYDGETRSFNYEAIEITIEHDPVIRLNGWTLIAKITHEQFGNVINMVPGEEADLSFYRDRACYCDHCSSYRKRNDTFILRNETGEMKQIGRNCLADYIRHEKAAEIISLYEDIREYTGSIGSDDDFCMLARKVEQWTVSMLLGYALKAIDLYGYKSKKMVMDRDDLASTSEDMTLILNPRLLNGRQNPDYIKPEDLDMSEVPAIVDWLSVRFANPSNDFEHNMQIISNAEFLSRRYFGHIAYAVQAFRKDRQEKIAAQNTPKMASEHKGNIGDKIQVEIILLKETPIETTYGTSYLWIMQDNEGNIYKWFASNPPEVNEGDKLTIKGTVKSHDVYGGTKQTALTRCKVV